MKRCIWCKTLNEGETEEHIFPEAIGCPPEFVFNDGTVCGKCNNGFGYIDKAVIDQFDVFTFENGVKRKNNKKPSIKSRGNFIGGYKNGEKYYFINMGKESTVDSLGNHVAPFRGKERDVKATLDVDGNIGKVSFDIALTNRKNFRRGITKIAFSALAYFLGG